MSRFRKSTSPALLRAGAVVVAGLSAAALPAQAQETVADGYVVTSRAEAPTSPDAAAYSETAQGFRVETEMTYATGIEGDITGGARREVRKPRSSRFAPGGGNALGVLMVIFALIFVLFLWLRFGGSGMLLARAPSETTDAPNRAAPDSWRIDGDAARNPHGLLARLIALPDRREAMIQLLRHCLLRAADESNTRFARADTEREAFGRLPSSWRQHAALNQLLRDTELVHYGGRDVTEAVFERAFELGGTMLRGARHA